MAKQKRYLRSFLTGTLVFAAWLPGCNRTLASAAGESPGWGQERLKGSERAYYVDRVNRILEAWRGMTRQTQRRNPAETESLPYLCLVVDTDNRELGVESDGRVLPEHHSSLPAGIDWSLYRVAQGANIPLPAVSRFRLPGAPARSDQVLLLGQNESQYIYFSFSSTGRGSGYGSIGAEDTASGGVPAFPGGRTAGEQPYESLVVSPGAYERAKASFHSTFIPVEPAVLTQNKSVWLNVEKLLYQEMERHVSRRGWQLSELRIDCGPDYTAATAQVHSLRKGPRPLLSRKRAEVRTALRIDSLGNDVWYVKSESARLDVEFLVCATGSIPESDQAALLQQGRTKLQEMLVIPASAWGVRLPNGATVELVGICENPSAGRQWWGPDGSLLGYAPYATRELPCLSENHAIYDIVWRVDPPQDGGLQMRATPEGFRVPNHGQFRDRYGSRIDLGLDLSGYTFEPSREKATLEFIVRNAQGEPAAVTFKNISLVRGSNQGFEIETGK